RRFRLRVLERPRLHPRRRGEPVRSLRKLLATALLGAAIGLAPTRAFAEAPPSPSDLPRRQATFSWDRGRTILRVNVSYRDVVDATVQKQLSSGLPTTIVMR